LWAVLALSSSGREKVNYIQSNDYRFPNLRQKAYAWLSGGLSKKWGNI
jgi:hypothetical protein